MRATAHGLDRGILADVARDDDKRNVEVGRFEHGEGARRTELRLAVIGDDQVPTGAKLGREFWLGLDALPCDGETGTAEVLGDQQGVIRPVLQDQDAQRHNRYVPIRTQKVRNLGFRHNK